MRRKTLSRFVPVSVNTTGKARTEKFQGRDYFVAPAVMMTEGVHTGSGGPVLYSNKFLKKDPEAWDHKPIVVYHPKRDGRYVSAGDPDILNNSGVGFLLRTRFDSNKRGWKTECWFDKNQTKKVDPRVYSNLENGKVTEVSTGMFLRCAKKKGEWNGQKYSYEALRSRANDHLAILPDQKGACSVDKGAGLNVNSLKLRGFITKDLRTNNEMSFDEISMSIRNALASANKMPGYTWNGHVVEVYDGFCIYCIYGGAPDYKYTYYKQTYNVKNGKVELTGKPVQVERKVSYDPVANATSTKEDDEMAVKNKKAFNRRKHIRRLIGNGFEETDRVWLEELEDDQLSKISPKPIVNKEEPDDDTTDDDIDDEKEERRAFNRRVRNKMKRKAKMAVNKEEKEPKIDFNALIANADPKTLRTLRNKLGIDSDVLREQKIATQRERAKMVQAIVANEANTFTEKELKAMSTRDLKRIARFAANTAPAGPNWDDDGDGGGWGSLYIGQNTVRPTTNATGEEEDRVLEATPMFNEGGDPEDEFDYDSKPSQKSKEKSGKRKKVAAR